VIELRVPALRERPGDIAELATHILSRLARRSAGGSAQITPEALELLNDYTFPGNVRELENILERALTLSVDATIRPEDIRLRAVPRVEAEEEAGPATDPSALPAAPPMPAGSALGDRLEDMEREAIVQALEKTRYNKTAAAKLLGVTFRALRYRIKKLGIE
jgi:two-component system response regulator PilR (NtrC family)